MTRAKGAGEEDIVVAARCRIRAAVMTGARTEVIGAMKDGRIVTIVNKRE